MMRWPARVAMLLMCSCILALSACGNIKPNWGIDASEASAGTPMSTNTAISGTGSGAFQVSGVSLVSTPSAVNGICAPTITFTVAAQIAVPRGSPGGRVFYRWVRNGSVTAVLQTLDFAPGVTAQTVTDTWSLDAASGNGQGLTDFVQVVAPNAVSSSQVSFSLNCFFNVTSLYTSVTPSSYDCTNMPPTENFVVTSTLGLGPAPATAVSYYWLRSDGMSVPGSIEVAGDAAAISLSYTWAMHPRVSTGNKWVELVITSPVSITSNQAGFTKACRT